jgi:hypothetical protein
MIRAAGQVDWLSGGLERKMKQILHSTFGYVQDDKREGPATLD